MSSFITSPEATMTQGACPVPAHYGNVADEYQRLVAGNGFLEDPVTQWLEISGPDAESFLMGMLTLDLKAIALHHEKPAFALDAAGKILTFVRVYRQMPDCFFVGCPSGTAAPLAAHLNRYIIMEDVQLREATDQTSLTFVGNDLSTQAVTWCQDHQAAYFYRNRAGVPVIECVVPKLTAQRLVGFAVAADYQPIGWAAYEQARIEAFEPLFPQDIAPETNPVIYGIEEAISARKGCYIGQETVAMTRDRGRPPYVLVQLRAHSDATATTMTDLFLDGKTVGHSHSQVFSTKFHVAMRIGVVKFKVMADQVTQLVDGEGHAWHIDRFNYPDKS